MFICKLLILLYGLLHTTLSYPNSQIVDPAETHPEWFSIDGYRVTHYRSPTPEQVRGGVTISTEQLHQWTEKPDFDALLLDVQPVSWYEGHFLISAPRYNLSGSHWIPNVGLGEPDDRWLSYFGHYLATLTGGNKKKALIIYCTADCWMSWNAVNRAAEWGYQEIYWYRDGTDGWQEAELPLVEATPLPLP